MRSNFGGVLFAALFWCLAANAQESNENESADSLASGIPDEDVEGQVTEPSATQIPKDGLRLGSLLITPAIAVRAEYDTNLFATRTDEVDDWLLVLLPSLGIDSDWQRHEFEVNAGAAIVRHQTYETEDVEDYWVDASGQIDYAKRGYLFGGAAYSREHEDRGSPESSRAGIGPTTFDSVRGHLGLSQSLGNWTLRLGGTAESLTYDDVFPVSNSDRNRDMFGGGLRATYRLNPRFALYAQGVWDRREYEQPVDDLGYQRDSEGYLAGVGLQARPVNRLSGELYIGYIEQDYEDLRFETLRKPDFAARLRYLTGPLSDVSLRISRSLEETTLPEASGFLSTSYTLSGNRRFSQRLSGSVGMAYTDIDYSGIDRRDAFWSGSASADYAITRNLHLQARYRYLARDSATEYEIGNPANRQYLEDYAREQASLALTADLYPVRSPARFVSSASAGEERNRWSIYGAVAADHEALILSNSGVRDQGTDEAERAALDSGLAGLIGIDVTYEGWRLGLEAERSQGGASIYEQKTKASSRTLSFNADTSNAVSLLGGRRIGGAGWILAGVGFVETDFEVDYQINSAPENAERKRDREQGTRWRLGVEADVGARGFVRLDHALSTYESMTADLESETEDFEPALVTSRLAIGLRLSRMTDTDSVGQFSGTQDDRRLRLHGGVQLGHTVLQSQLEGSHQDGGGGGSPEPSEFTADFGSYGGVLSAIFMGADLALGDIRVGVEGEYAGNSARWAHLREPTGRTFGVEMKEETAYSLRLGYQLKNGALLYGRVGEARARFVTTWIKGGNRDNDVARDDRKSGRRWGVGMELPLGGQGFLRGEYTYTQYDDYGFTTSHGAADSMRFENEVSAFRVGVGLRL
jgi:opacity protein-like surface antigen